VNVVGLEGVYGGFSREEADERTRGIAKIVF
jgi:hypothetical protein